MRLRHASIERYGLPLVRPLQSARGELSRREGAILRLVDDRGHLGLGDAAPLPGFSEEDLGLVERRLGELAASALLDEDLPESVPELARWVASLALPPSAAHALDQALLTVLSARANVPLSRLLAGEGPVRARVPVHALVATVEQACAARRSGYALLKIKIGVKSPAEEDAWLAQLRRALGEAIELRLDANGCFGSAEQALARLHALARFRVQAVEQPVPAAALDELAQVRRESPIAVMADESVRNLAELERVIAAGAADALVIKPMLVGGLGAAYELGARAAAAGLPVSVTTSLESGIGRRGALEVAAALPGQLWTSGLATGELFSRDLTEPDRVQGGFMALDGRPTRPHGAGMGPLRPSPAEAT